MKKRVSYEFSHCRLEREARFTSAAIGIQELLGVVTEPNQIRWRHACIVDTDVVAQHVLDVQHELVAEHVHRGVLTPAGAAEVENDLIADRGALKKARRRKRGAKIDRHIELVRGRGDADTTEGQRDMLDLTMTNAWSATTTASTRTRHRGTEEFSEI